LSVLWRRSQEVEKEGGIKQEFNSLGVESHRDDRCRWKLHKAGAVVGGSVERASTMELFEINVTTDWKTKGGGIAASKFPICPF